MAYSWTVTVDNRLSTLEKTQETLQKIQEERNKGEFDYRVSAGQKFCDLEVKLFEGENARFKAQKEQEIRNDFLLKRLGNIEETATIEAIRLSKLWNRVNDLEKKSDVTDPVSTLPDYKRLFLSFLYFMMELKLVSLDWSVSYNAFVLNVSHASKTYLIEDDKKALSMIMDFQEFSAGKKQK